MGTGCSQPAGAATTGLAVDAEGQVERLVPIPSMPITGGEVEALTPDGQPTRFMVPAGYPDGTKVRMRYRPLPKPKAKASAKAKPDTSKPAAGSGAMKPTPSGTSSATTPATPASLTPPTGSGQQMLPATSSQSRGGDASREAKPLMAPPSPAGGDAPKGPIQVQTKVVHPELQGLPVLPLHLPMFNGSWDWIRHSNDEIHRLTRLDAGELLQETFKKGGYALQQESGEVAKVKYTCLKQLVQGTRVLSMKEGLPALAKDPGYMMELEYGKGISCIDKAETMALQKPPLRPATINAASAFHAGGGFTTGGRHALEEAFCSQSTLYLSLEKAMAIFEAGCAKGLYRKDDIPGYHRHIPADGCILSPSVEIFRGSTDQGYHAFTKSIPVAAVVSVAMFNKNRGVRDAPVDAPSDSKEYEDGVLKKFTAMLHAAALSGADSIIIPDVGCGVFQNDPAVCGKILGQALHKYRTRFKRAVFTGNDKFFTAASDSLKEAGAKEVVLSSKMTTRFSETLGKDALRQVRSCTVCKKSLAGADFKNLAILIDGTHNSRTLQFLHATCTKKVTRSKFPKHYAMTLPDITITSQGFLKALDLDGNGCISRDEVACICALLWDGDLEKDYDTFEADFAKRWSAWDSDRSGDVSLEQIKAQVQFGLDDMPQSLIQYVQQQ
eukprot:CAMPEP_0178389928 /NCGR_PEP_ID=MMETSP0689_2-20121128/10381_1 /TAXON_ID=160604 /ORGANISM="Amphidinium massartii, Strain CS-259" /LENGTH=666 /DNA_ID=CAMNT_0020010417 /DNA_START=64 /DNA_END=2061 /DNA_ORIENTATION=+